MRENSNLIRVNKVDGLALLQTNIIVPHPEPLWYQGIDRGGDYLSAGFISIF